MLTIYFDNQASNNSTLSPDQAAADFSISWDYLANIYYTLVIYDIDIADCSVNFLAFNILANDISKANKIVDYNIPRIRTKDVHTFVVDLYIQKDKVKDFDSIKQMNIEDRYCSKAENLISEANLELVERTTFLVSTKQKCSICMSK